MLSAIAMNQPIATDPSMAPTEFQVLLEPLENGHTLASVPQLPNCWVEGQTREDALVAVKCLLADRLAKGEWVTVQVQPLNVAEQENPWLPFLGLFQDSDAFAEIADALWAERQVDHDEAILDEKGDTNAA